MTLECQTFSDDRNQSEKVYFAKHFASRPLNVFDDGWSLCPKVSLKAKYIFCLENAFVFKVNAKISSNRDKSASLLSYFSFLLGSKQKVVH